MPRSVVVLTTIARSGLSFAAAASTCPISVRPAATCMTFGSADFMRVPWPAARITMASLVTRRPSTVDSRNAAGARAERGAVRSARGAENPPKQHCARRFLPILLIFHAFQHRIAQIDAKLQRNCDGRVCVAWWKEARNPSARMEPKSGEVHPGPWDKRSIPFRARDGRVTFRACAPAVRTGWRSMR